MISIPKPCHENWSDMTPTQKGAFCGKCQIDVIDFSKMSDEEIKQTLIAQRGNHLCGKFKSTQLDNFNLKYSNWENQSYAMFQSKFILACLITFGMSLFSCTNQQHSNLKTLKSINRIEITDSRHETENTTLIETINTINNLSEVQGQVSTPEEVEIENSSCPTQTVLLGDMVIEEEFYERHVKGEIYLEENILFFESDTISENKNTEKILAEITAIAYPNPVQYITTLKVESNQSATTQIIVFDANARVILNVYDGIIENGINEFDIDLSNFKAGNYYIQINQANTTNTVKVVKL